MTIGVGIVGCGLIGRKRMQSLPVGTEFVGAFDIDPDRAAALAAEAGKPDGATRSMDELLSTPGLQLVVVSAVHDQLTPLTAAALEAGCHVLVEKPGATDRASLAPIEELARSAERSVRVGYNHRFHPSFAKLRELVADRNDGDLLFVRGRYGHGGRVGYEQEWRADKVRSGGGELLDQGSHLIDLTRSLVGDVTLAYASLPTLYWPMAVEDNAFLCLDVNSGGKAWLHASWTEWKNIFSFEISFTRAKYEVAGLGGSYGPERLILYSMSPAMGPPLVQSWEWPPGDHSWQMEMRDVVAGIDGQPTVGATLHDALATLGVIEEAYRR